MTLIMEAMTKLEDSKKIEILEKKIEALQEKPSEGTVAYYTRERHSMQLIIDDYRREINRLASRVSELETYEQGGKFYLRMQNHIKNSENIQAAWNEFYTMYAMCVPDINDLK